VRGVIAEQRPVLALGRRHEVTHQYPERSCQSRNGNRLRERGFIAFDARDVLCADGRSRGKVALRPPSSLAESAKRISVWHLRSLLHAHADHLTTIVVGQARPRLFACLLNTCARIPMQLVHAIADDRRRVRYRAARPAPSGRDPLAPGRARGCQAIERARASCEHLLGRHP